ncbi:MAG TPA: PH domain-containing protein [Acidimicrobiales bacterium]|nr:PH domain-containing protein [Acidimicrobiales bacterium]
MTESAIVTTWKSPSPRLWKMRCLEAGSVGALVALVAGLAGAQAGAVPGAAAAGGAVLSTGVVLRFLRNRFRSWAYQERDEDLVVKRGVAFRRLSVVPYGRMQFVDVTAGPVERLFKLSTIKLHTAAAASDARIPGLERDEAARLRDQLASLGEAKAAGL